MFELEMPWALCLSFMPVLIGLLPKLPELTRSAVVVPFFEPIYGCVRASSRVAKGHPQAPLFWVIWLLLVLACAGPKWVGPPSPLDQRGHNIMLALDISPSMSVRDMALNQRAATRFSVVKRAAESFVAARSGDKIGLILFGQHAYLLTPLTYDHHAVLDRLADASVGLAGQTTSIGDALGLAVKRLQQVPPDGRVIILLTDGVNNSGVLTPQKAAELAQLDGIKVYTIGLGAESNSQAFGGMFINATQTAELDEETLKIVADMTGGRYFRATDMASLQSIYALINRMELATQEQTRARPETPYYVWPLGMALGLLFYWFVRRLGVRFYA